MTGDYHPNIGSSLDDFLREEGPEELVGRDSPYSTEAPESAVVCQLPNGCTLYRRPNGVGGFRYFSDEVGGGVEVWDTCCVDQGTLLCAMAEEAKRAYTEFMLQERRDREELAQTEALREAQLAKDREERWECGDRDRCDYCGSDAYNGRIELADGVMVSASAEIKKVMEAQDKQRASETGLIPIHAVGATVWCEEPGRIVGQVGTVVKSSAFGTFYTVKFFDGRQMLVDWPFVGQTMTTPAKSWWKDPRSANSLDQPDETRCM